MLFLSIDITKNYHENNISYQSQFSSEKQYKNYSNFNQEQLIKRRNPTLPPIDRYMFILLNIKKLLLDTV